MIKADQLCRKFGDSYAVEALSFHVRKGEVMGLLGPNGAGKSTTMKMLTCYLPPSSGSATVNGIPLHQSLQVRSALGYLPEQAPSYRDMDVRSHLRFIGSMHGMPRATLEDRIGEMSRLCGLENCLQRKIDELSKGYRQRVGLAASMLHDPVCLILDEPTTGLDPNQIVEIRHLIRRLSEKKTVLLSSHVLSEVEAVCDRMMIIDRGELQVIGTASELADKAQSGVALTLTLKLPGEVMMANLAELYPELSILKQDDLGYQLTHPDPDFPLAETLFSSVVESGNIILVMQPSNTSLEDVFRKLTGVER